METYEEIKNKIEGKRKRNGFVSFLEFMLALFVLALSFLIYAKNDEDALFLKQYFNIDVSFKQMNEQLGFQLSSWLSSLNIFQKSENETYKVSTSLNYISMGNNYYTCETNEVPLLFKGKIINIHEVNSSYNVNVYYENGVNACYYELNNIYINKGDVLKTSEPIGTYEEKFKVIFEKNSKRLTYEEVLLS